MKNKGYKLGLNGELISENSLNFLNEGNGFNLEKAKARAKSVSSTSSQTVVSDKSKIAGSDKSIIETADLRIFEYVLYSSVFQTIAFTFKTYPLLSYGDKQWSTYWDTSKKYFFKNAGEHPFKEFSGYIYWYEPLRKKFFGESKSSKSNLENQVNSYFFDNKYKYTLESLDKIPWYTNRKKEQAIQNIFNNVYTQMDKIIAELYNAPQQYTVQFPYISSNLKKYPDEATTYFDQVTATSGNKTLIEQLTGVGFPDLNEVYRVDNREVYRKHLTDSQYTMTLSLPNGKKTTVFPLKM